MALFPRKIGGKYAMIARQDNENLYLIYSDDLTTWDGGQAILKPEVSPGSSFRSAIADRRSSSMRLAALTHGVGPVRKYSIGAALLDKNDPSKVLARSRAAAAARTVRSARATFPTSSTPGAMRHNDQIILPYAVSDTFSISRPSEFGADAGDEELIAALEGMRADRRCWQLKGAPMARNKLLRAGIQRRQGRKPQGRCADRVQVGNRRAANGGATGLEQTRRRRLLGHRRPRDGRL
jgi:hypothetical protein